MIHEDLLKAAKEAIENVFSDTSVDLEDTLNDMKELREAIDNNIVLLKEDIEYQKLG